MDLKEQYMLMPYDLSGSRSKNRFRIELLWGIDKMLDLMESDVPFTMVFDYVCDIEVHTRNGFEFYQIKTHSKSQPAYTTTSLTRVEKANSQGSILGKLFVLNTSSGRKDKIAIVSNSPYKMSGYDACNGTHCFTEFPQEEQQKIADVIKKELHVSNIDISTAYYICTNIDLEEPQKAIIGKLVLSFKKIKGCEVDRVETLYRLIYDQVSEKACYELKARCYDELLVKKGISRDEMDYILNCHARSAKTGIDRTRDYIDSIPDLFVRKAYIICLAKLVENLPTDRFLQKMEKDIAIFLHKLDTSGQQSGELSDLIDRLTAEFHSAFPVEYDDAEKTVFYVIIIYKYFEGVYDENDIQ